MTTQRTRSVVDAERGAFSLVERCRRYGVSCPTGYRWLAWGAAAGLVNPIRI